MLTLLSAMIALGFVQSPSFQGDWQGAIEVPESPLEVHVSISAKDQNASGSIDIPAQNARDVPLENIAIDGDSISFTIGGASGNPTFDGTLSGGVIEGSFTQGGQSFPFQLSRLDHAGEVSGGQTGGSVSSTESPLTPKEALERFFAEAPIQPSWFTESFSNQIAIPQLDNILQQFAAELGDYQRIEGEGNELTVIFADGTVKADVRLDTQGRFSRLLFTEVAAGISSPEEAAERLRDLPGESSLLVTENDEEVVALNAEEPLAVGSAFKLAVLAALMESNLDMNRVVELKSEWRSLPTGVLQEWPAGMPVTVATLTSLMISLSDNTATEALMDLVGREALRPFAGSNEPFLSPNEAFLLKEAQNSDLLERYRSGDRSSQQSVLREIDDQPLPDIEAFSGQPSAINSVEWFYSTRTLCDLMSRIESSPFMSINPGLANPDNWERVAFKGGSEPGVYNLTTWLESENGTTYCISMTQNNANSALNEDQLNALYTGLLEVLAR